MVRVGVMFFLLIVIFLVYLCVVYHYSDTAAKIINKYLSKFKSKKKKKDSK